MRIFPKELEIGPNDGFKAELDIFKRKQFGEGLANLFAQVEDPMVAVLDSPWGSGKTTFIKMWCGHMRNKGFPVIYFDAFKNDYVGDAFTAIAGEVIALADEQGQKNKDARKDFVNKAAGLVSKVGAAIKGGFRKGVSKLIGEDGLEEVGEALQDGSDCLADSLGDYFRERLEGRQQEREAFESFGISLSSLAGEMSKIACNHCTEIDDPLPLIFVIDELDRCRPPFALDVIETIKHFYSSQGVHFLLVTHMEQLENSVRYAYGMDGQAGNYLQKFYHVVLKMPEKKDVRGALYTMPYLKFVFNGFPPDDENGQYTEMLIELIDDYAVKNRLTFRSIERVATHAALVLAYTREDYLRIGPIIVGLCIFKTLHPLLYDKARQGSLTYSEVADELGSPPVEVAVEEGLWAANWWAYCLIDDIVFEDYREQIGRYGSSFRFMSINRHSFVSKLCDLLDELKVPDAK